MTRRKNISVYDVFSLLLYDFPSKGFLFQSQTRDAYEFASYLYVYREPTIVNLISTDCSMNFKHSALRCILTCSHVHNEIRTINPVRTVFLSSEHCSGTEDNLFNCYFVFCHRQNNAVSYTHLTLPTTRRV